MAGIIMGIIGVTDSTGSSPSSSGTTLRKASVIVFLVLTLLQAYQTFTLIMAERSGRIISTIHEWLCLTRSCRGPHCSHSASWRQYRCSSWSCNIWCYRSSSARARNLPCIDYKLYDKARQGGNVVSIGRASWTYMYHFVCCARSHSSLSQSLQASSVTTVLLALILYIDYRPTYLLWTYNIMKEADCEVQISTMFVLLRSKGFTRQDPLVLHLVLQVVPSGSIQWESI